MHQEFDPTPGGLPGVFHSDDGEHWGDYEDSYGDEYGDESSDGGTYTPLGLVVGLKGPKGPLLSTFNFPEALYLGEGDVLHLSYTMTIDDLVIDFVSVEIGTENCAAA